MVSYIQWYHQPFNDTPKLLRTGASSGNPYSYVIKVRRDQHQVFTVKTLHQAARPDLIAQNLAHLAFYLLNRLSLPLPTQYFFILLPLHSSAPTKHYILLQSLNSAPKIPCKKKDLAAQAGDQW